MSDVAIRVENLGKRYRINPTISKENNYVGQFSNLIKNPFYYLKNSHKQDQILWALRNVNFEIKKGEIVGILGPNGAGKSTLLSISSRITLPTEGWADVFGRVGSLLQVGTGFHNELTGRENIYLNGAILGMKKSEVRSKFDEIVEFSGISNFIDMPIKRYSSGMKVRLGLSVAIFLDPEILLIDEVLSVGDASFRKQSIEKVHELIGEGRSVLLVSHDIYTVQRLCQRSILIENGKIVKDAPTDEIVDFYLPSISNLVSADAWVELRDFPRNGTGRAVFSRVKFYSTENSKSGGIQPDQPVEFFCEINSTDRILISGIAVTIFDKSGFRLLNAGEYSEHDPQEIKKGKNFIKIRIESLHLKSGTYMFALWLNGVQDELLDNIQQVAFFNVISQDNKVEELNPFRDKITANVTVKLYS